MEEIILYSTHCPKCKTVELLLAKKNPEFTMVDDIETVVEVGKAHGIMGAPILQVGDEFFDFSKAVQFLNKIQ